jgi:hypothetical protein
MLEASTWIRNHRRWTPEVLSNKFPCKCGHLEKFHLTNDSVLCRHSSDYMFDCRCDRYQRDNLRYLESLSGR